MNNRTPNNRIKAWLDSARIAVVMLFGVLLLPAFVHSQEVVVPYITPGSQTFIVPQGVTSITVECWGGGGAGGRAANGTGGGGAGGSYARSVITVVPGTTYEVVVAAAKTSEASASGNKGNASWFGLLNNPLVRADGGNGGTTVVNVTSGNGGASSIGNSIGDVKYPGGAGATGSAGGAGGGGAGSNGPGGNASSAGSGTGTATNGGNGGIRSGKNSVGNPGSIYGGGGGGGDSPNDKQVNSGGLGAQGMVQITYQSSNQSAYCTPSHTTGTQQGDFISRVVIGTINNATFGSASPYYTYYNALQTDLEKTRTYTITVGSGTYQDNNNISVWIDFNNNSSFEASEKLGNVVLAKNKTGSITFTVPSTAINGITRMRVRETYNNSNITPCDVYDFGETEDYNINICSANQWTGNISTNWHTLGNWTLKVPDVSSDAHVPTGRPRYPLIATGATAICKTVYIEPGASLTVQGTLQITENVQNSGSLNAGTGTIEMKGTSSQVIPENSFLNNNIASLIINNINGVTLNGTLEISGYLKAQTGDLQTNGYLTLLSTATKTAFIDGSGTGAVLGNVTMQRYLPSAFGYKYFSSPFSNATVAEFSDDIDLTAPFATMYRYEQNKVSTGWEKYVTPASPLVPGVGYSLNFGTSKNPKTVSTSGVVNNGTISLTLQNHNQQYTKGFNLVGNPYPSPIDWKSATGWTKNNIDDALYFFASGDTNQYYGTYSSFVNNVSSDGKASGIIAAQQGFFVHVSDGSFPVQGTLTFTNQVRVANQNPLFFKNSTIGPRSYFRISAKHSDSKSADYLVVYFNEGAVDDFDPATDALKLFNTDPSVPNIYTRSRDNKNLSIDAVNFPLENTVSIPLVVASGKRGTITIKATDIVELPYDYFLYIKDNQTGKIQDLQATPEYRFDAKEETLSERFTILLSKSKLSQEILGTKSFNARIQDGIVYLNLSLKEEQVMVQVTDLMGRTIIQSSVYGEGDHKLGLLQSTGIYIVSIYTDMGIISKKIYLQ